MSMSKAEEDLRNAAKSDDGAKAELQQAQDRGEVSPESNNGFHDIAWDAEGGPGFNDPQEDYAD